MKDKELKIARKEKLNSSKYKKHGKTRKGDSVLLRNYKRTSKFQPFFMPDPFTVTSVDGAKITAERDGKVLKRHLDDVKTLPVNVQKTSATPNTGIRKSQDLMESWQRAFKNLGASESDQESEFIIEIRADANQVVIANQVPTVAIPDGRTGSKRPSFLRAQKRMLVARNVSKAKRLAPHTRILRSHSTLRSSSAANTPVAEKETAEYL